MSADADRGDAGASGPASTAMAAVAELYHAFFTALILALVSRRGPRLAAELVFRVFRRKQQEQFLPGLEKLGLAGLPHVVACAQYHYLSNWIGGVAVEYVYESDRKAWIRYPPPRWIWQGTAVAAIPGEVSAAMLRGWHAHNGVSLGNPRLGFVCTKQTVDGQPGLEGYYCEHDRVLAPEERLRFARGEEAPRFDAEAAPRLAQAEWPPERLDKAFRNYAMDYAKTGLLEVVDLLGPADGGHLAGLAAKLVAMQLYRQSAQRCGTRGGDSEAFGELFLALARAQGDEAEASLEGDRLILRQRTWRLLRGAGPSEPSVFEAWNRLWEGLLAAHDRFLRWEVRERLDLGDPCFEWWVRERQRP